MVSENLGIKLQTLVHITPKIVHRNKHIIIVEKMYISYVLKPE